jgi:hypothetical protein
MAKAVINRQVIGAVVVMMRAFHWFMEQWRWSQAREFQERAEYWNARAKLAGLEAMKHGYRKKTP